MGETLERVTLREISGDTLLEVLELKVAPHQESFVAANATSIAEAHFHPEVAWFRAVYAGETPVGFVMLSDDPDAHKYYLWRFMIAERFQGHGYGRKALELVCAYVRTRPGATVLMTSAAPAPGGPTPFCEKMGFALTGEVEEDELVMRLDL